MRKGFTIVEAVVIFGIICILTGLLILAVEGARAKVREQQGLDPKTGQPIQQVETPTPGKFRPPFVRDAILRENFEYQQEKIRELEERLERLERASE